MNSGRAWRTIGITLAVALGVLLIEYVLVRLMQSRTNEENALESSFGSRAINQITRAAGQFGNLFANSIA